MSIGMVGISYNHSLVRLVYLDWRCLCVEAVRTYMFVPLLSSYTLSFSLSLRLSSKSSYEIIRG